MSRQRLASAIDMACEIKAAQDDGQGHNPDGHDHNLDGSGHEKDDQKKTNDAPEKLVTSKELEEFVKGMVKQHVSTKALKKLTMTYKKKHGLAMLETIIKRILAMQRDRLPPKLIYDELERTEKAPYRALVDALGAIVNDNGRMPKGWEDRNLNTNSEEITQGPPKPPFKVLIKVPLKVLNKVLIRSSKARFRINKVLISLHKMLSSPRKTPLRSRKMRLRSLITLKRRKNN